MNQYIMNLILVFVLTAINSLTGNLRNILLIKGEKYSKYIVTAIDTFLYIVTLKMVVNNDGIMPAVALVLGKLLGLFLAGIVENKMFKKTYSIKLFFNDLVDVHTLENKCIKENISVTSFTGYFGNRERYQVEIHVNKKQQKELFEYLKNEMKIDNPTGTIEEIKPLGNITDRIE